MEGESGNNTISGNTIENNHNGIVVLGFGTWIIGGSALNVYDNIQRGSHEIPPPIPSNHTIAGNTIFDNFNGILLYSRSSGNTVKGNTIKGNLYGIYIDTGPNSSNILYHNNFIDNPIQVGRDRLTPAFLNTWDNGAEGNYWSDYNGTDMNGDGIGDTPHVIDEKDGDGYPLIEKDQDNYPLMAPWSDFRVFNIPLEEKVYQAAMFSNSTIASFNFSHLNKQISFNVTGPSGTSGFCNVTIPKTLLRANETNPWQVLLDGNPINYTKVENATHTSLYFTYTHSTHHVQIIGTWVTPEFPTALILPLLIITAILATILGKITRSTKKPHNYANSKRSD